MFDALLIELMFERTMLGERLMSIVEEFVGCSSQWFAV